MIINIIVLIATYVNMELVTWLTHKYVMHGMMWYFHQDHHDIRKRRHRWIEKNDVFFLIFAIPSVMMFYLGSFKEGLSLLNYIAGGITLYGLTYFLIHDVLIHRRFRFLDNYNNRYFNALRKAHKAHHKHLGKKDGECFGLLFVPKKYFKKAGDNYTSLIDNK